MLLNPWTTIARKGPGTLHSWRPTKLCPTGQGDKALLALRAEVEDGKYFMAQKRVAPFEYDLMIKRRLHR